MSDSMKPFKKLNAFNAEHISVSNFFPGDRKLKAGEAEKRDINFNHPLFGERRFNICFPILTGNVSAIPLKRWYGLFFIKERVIVLPINTAKKFEIKFVQVLDESGKADEKLLPKLTTDELKELYEDMLLARVFDEKCVALQRQGRMGTYASGLGQEAAQVGSAHTLERKDWIVPSFRESAALLARGSPLAGIMRYWAGDERGHNLPQGVNNFPIAIPVGSQPLHAVGIAWASLLKKDGAVVLSFSGDGGTSEGDFSEALNFAGVFKTPCVFIVQNNQWAISVPRTKQTAAETIAQKAIAYGFEGIQVDGNDVLAVYKVVRDAVAKARSGKGPTLVECVTYRIADHTTADDAARYRTQKEVDAWKKKDPVLRFQKYLQSVNIWDASYETKVLSKCKNQVEEAVKDMESTPAPSVEDMFTYVYAEMTAELEEQKDYIVEMKRQRQLEPESEE